MPIPILMPALSPTMEEGTLAKWFVKAGDQVEMGDLIAEIETDKATMEVESVEEGRVGKILVVEGTDGVKVNETIALILEEGEDARALEGAVLAPPVPKSELAATEKPPSAPVSPAPQSAPVATIFGDRVKASPLARRLAAQTGLDLAEIRGSGPHGRVLKQDVEAASKGAVGLPVAAAATAQVIPFGAPIPSPNELGIPEASYDELPLNAMRKVVARRMTESKQTVPHFPITIDCEIDMLMALRKELNSRSPEGEDAFRISVNDFVVRASALALKKVPGANASFAGDKICLHHHADIAVAVALEGGLITPIIWQAETKGLKKISKEMKDKASRSRERKLLPEEYQGGTFSISNLGMFGVKEFNAVINPPHGAILAVGQGEQRPVVKDGALTIATVMSCTLSCDHRVVDGALGAQWLQVFKGYIEDPVTMLL